ERPASASPVPSAPLAIPPPTTTTSIRSAIGNPSRRRDRRRPEETGDPAEASIVRQLAEVDAFGDYRPIASPERPGEADRAVMRVDATRSQDARSRAPPVA